MSYPKETPALNADGTYKEANEMEWDDDKSPPQTPLSSLPSGNASSSSIFTFQQQLGPEDYMDTSRASGTNTITSSTRKAFHKGKERATNMASMAASINCKKKPAAIERFVHKAHLPLRVLIHSLHLHLHLMLMKTKSPSPRRNVDVEMAMQMCVPSSVLLTQTTSRKVGNATSAHKYHHSTLQTLSHSIAIVI